MTDKAVVLLSGGLDSTTLLYEAVKRKEWEALALSVNYGQRHKRELTNAAMIAALLGVRHHVAELGPLVAPLLAGSSQTSSDIDVPEGHYAEESMKLTVVPNRNMVLLSLATAWAISEKADYVAYAAHAGDHAIYPDCRREFVDALGKAILLCDYEPPLLYTPFIAKSKAEIVEYGYHLGVPFEMTRSCYKEGFIHCSVCGTCMERRLAFREAQIPDPTEYELSEDEFTAWVDNLEVPA